MLLQKQNKATRTCCDKCINMLCSLPSIAPSKLLTPAGAQPSKRLQVDEDTSLTLGAASVFGLTVVVGAFLVVSALTSSDVAADVAATAKETTQEAARKLPAVPKPLPVSLPGAPSPDTIPSLLLNNRATQPSHKSARSRPTKNEAIQSHRLFPFPQRRTGGFYEAFFQISCKQE